MKPENLATNQQDHEAAVRQWLKQTLPDYQPLRREARQQATGIKPGRSAFLDHFGMASELEYKQQAIRDGQIMYHAHIGMNDIESTATALSQINQVLSAQGFRLDRAGVALDRRMGLPTESRDQVAAETGPMLETREDWSLLAQSAPIQPHLGDFMIGQPASVANTCHALEIGCTTIGNLSQYFTFEAPGWKDTATTAIKTCQAMEILARFRNQGVMLHSYLEDGFGALFHHCETIAGWALLERYIVQELIGARLSHCIGGLTSDPVKRCGWVIALQRIHQGDHVGSMFYGDTISFGPDFEKNRAVTAEYLMWDILAQLHTPSGHAVLPLPVSEAIRIPSAEEIIEAQLFGRQIEASARRLFPHVDFSAAEGFAEQVCQQGAAVFERALTGLADLGVDTRNPLQMLFVLKKLGAVGFESLFGKNVDQSESISTDMMCLAHEVVDRHREQFLQPDFVKRVKDRCIVVASSDVHVHAAGALAQLLSEAGAEIIYLGAEQNPQDLIAAIKGNNAEALLLSTHNGMALEYASQLKSLLDGEALNLPVVMGGVLNQKREGEVLPVPVVEELKALGMRPAIALPGLVRLLE
ncbi:MAG: cobalamin B12-binding domain-containing protein [Pseudomonadota bacterium]